MIEQLYPTSFCREFQVFMILFSCQLYKKMQTNYLGVDLSNYNCCQLKPELLYSDYKSEDLHFPIGAIQKGRKPHTEIGIKRIKKRNLIKKNKARMQRDEQAAVKPLIPKSPEQICMKALRTEFRNRIEKSHVHAEKSSFRKDSKIALRKENQKARRKELIDLVRFNRIILENKFGDRMVGYGKCPKVSRKEIKDFLGIKDQQKPVQTPRQKTVQSTRVSFPQGNQNPFEALMESEEHFPTLK